MALEVITKGVISELNESNPTGTDSRSEGDDHFRLIKQVLKKQFPGADGDGYKDIITTTEAELNALTGLDTTVPLEDRLDGLVGGVVGASFPVGTRLIFAQNSAPDGWGVVTSDEANGRMLHVVTTAASGFTTGGTHDPTKCDLVAAHTHPFTSSGSGGHTHTGTTNNSDHGHGAAQTTYEGRHKHTASMGLGGSHGHTAYNVVGGSVKKLQSGTSYGLTSQTIGPGGTHDHTVSLDYEDDHRHDLDIGEGTGGDHNHTFNTSSIADHNHTGIVNTNSNATKWEPKYLNVIVCERVA